MALHDGGSVPALLGTSHAYSQGRFTRHSPPVTARRISPYPRSFLLRRANAAARVDRHAFHYAN